MNSENPGQELVAEISSLAAPRGHYDVFISYRRLDGKAYARIVYNELTRRGFRCFFDFERIERGAFETVIKRAIERSRYVLPILTPHMFDEGSWSAREIEYALSLQRDNLVPVYPGDFNAEPGRKNCEGRSEFPIPLPEAFSSLKEIHFNELDVGVNFDHSMEKIVRAVTTLRVRLRRKRGLLLQLAVASVLGFAVWTQLKARETDLEWQGKHLQELARTKERYGEEITAAKADKEKYLSSMSAATNTIGKLEGLVKTLRSEERGLKEDLEEERQKLSAANLHVADLEKEKARLEGDVKFLANATNQLQLVEGERADLERQTASLKEAIEKVRNDLRDQQKVCGDLEKKVKDGEEACREWEVKYRKLQIEYLNSQN